MISNFRNEHFFLSNFYPLAMNYQGQTCDTLEHAFQSAKTHDPVEKLKVLACNTPGQAKRLSRTVTLRPDWDQVKVQIMLDLLRIKFQDSSMRYALVQTMPHELIEENEWGDKFWGVCRGVGQNVLGNLLMQVRDELAKELT